MIAVLLPVAVLATTTVDQRGPILDGRLSPAGMSLEPVPGDRSMSRSAGVTVVAPTISSVPALAPPVSVTTTVPPPTTSPSTTATPVVKGSTTSTLPPPPSSIAPTAVPPPPPPSNWSVDKNGISARMRMEPAQPVAGQPVTFFVELSPLESCCIVHLTFGDGSATPMPVEAGCTPRAETVRAVVTHTYAAPGAYQAILILATVPCAGPSEGQPFVPGMIYGANINACVVVGPSTRSTTACPQ